MSGSVKKELISGVLYTAVTKYSGILVTLVVAGVIARIVPPEDFGVMTIATIIISFLSVLSDSGIAPAVVQYKNLSKDDLSNIFSFTVWSGIAMSIVFFCGSDIIAKMFDDPDLVPVCKFLSVSLFFSTINIVPNALVYRDKRFKFISVRTLSVQVFAGIIAIVAALNGAGIYALLVNPIISSVVLAIINLKIYPQRLKFILGISSLRKILLFSGYQFLFNMLNFFARNLDKALIGKYMSMTDLGYYEKSYRLMMLPLQNITHVISPVMHPIFSTYSDNMAKLEESYSKLLRMVSFLSFPLGVFLLFTARELILIIFGPQWEFSIKSFEILSLSVGIQVILSTSGSIFQAGNDTKTLFVVGVLSTISSIVGVLAGVFIFDSIDAVAWGVTISFFINFMVCYGLMYRYTFKTKITPFLKKFASPALCAIILFAVLSVCQLLCGSMPLILSFILKVAVAAVYMFFYIQYTGVFDIKGKIKSIIKVRL